jgi:hypothetical protein
MPNNDKLARLHQDTQVPVSSRVSPSLHPDAISAHAHILVDDAGGPGETGYAAARKALQGMYSGMAEIDSAHTALLQPVQVGTQKADGKPIYGKSQVPEHRRAELASAMGAKAQRLGLHVERCKDTVDASIADLDTRITASFRHPKQDTTSVSQEAAEIRSYVKNLDKGTRVQFILNACQRKELNVVAAIVNFSPWISGLTPEEAELARSFARTAFSPRESKQADSLRVIKRSLETAVGSFGTEYAKRVPKVTESKADVALAQLKKVA